MTPEARGPMLGTMRALVLILLLGVACSGESYVDDRGGAGEGSGSATDEPLPSRDDSTGGATAAGSGGGPEGSGGAPSGGADAGSGGLPSGGGDGAGGTESGGSLSSGGSNSESGGASSGGSAPVLALTIENLRPYLEGGFGLEGDCVIDFSDNKKCDPLPMFDPPLMEWASCAEEFQALVRVPPGVCAYFSGSFDFAESGDDCGALPVTSCTQDASEAGTWTRSLEQETPLEQRLNRFRGCDPRSEPPPEDPFAYYWRIWFYEGECPPI